MMEEERELLKSEVGVGGELQSYGLCFGLICLLSPVSEYEWIGYLAVPGS